MRGKSFRDTFDVRISRKTQNERLIINNNTTPNIIDNGSGKPKNPKVKFFEVTTVY